MVPVMFPLYPLMSNPGRIIGICALYLKARTACLSRLPSEGVGTTRRARKSDHHPVTRRIAQQVIRPTPSDPPTCRPHRLYERSPVLLWMSRTSRGRIGEPL